MVGSVNSPWRRVAVPALVAVLAATGAAAAEVAAAAAAPTPGACVVVLDCPSGKQSVTANADGSFVLRGVPAEACTVAAAPADAAAPAAAPSSKTAVVAPRDAASGLPTGKRQHKPMAAPAAPMCSITLNGAQATPSADGSSLQVSSDKRRHELTGHVTLIK